MHDFPGIIRFDSGLPFRALSRTWFLTEPDNLTFVDTLAPLDLDLPLRPIFPGYLIDTLFYSAIWLALFVGPGAARRTIRRRRGRCPMCGYDLRGDLESGCPECGWGRK